MEILEVENLTLDSENLDEYLVIPDESTLTHITYPLKMGRLDCIWITKNKIVASVDNVLPFVRLSQEQYDQLGNIKYGTLYIIIDEENTTVKMYYNEKEYSSEQGIALISNAKLFIDEDGVIYSELAPKATVVLDTIFNNDEEIEYNSL